MQSAFITRVRSASVETSSAVPGSKPFTRPFFFPLPPIFQLGVHEEDLGTRLTQAHSQDITTGH